MRIWVIVPVALMALGLGSCTREESRREAADGDSAARKAGRTAHEIADKTEEAAKKAGRKIGQAAKEVREGWKEGDRDDRVKTRK